MCHATQGNLHKHEDKQDQSQFLINPHVSYKSVRGRAGRLTRWVVLKFPSSPKFAMAMAKAAMTRMNPMIPFTAECTGNHHLFVVIPLANLGTRVPSGRNSIVARAPTTRWAIITVLLSLPPPLPAVEPVDPVVVPVVGWGVPEPEALGDGEEENGAIRLSWRKPVSLCCLILAPPAEDPGLVPEYAQMISVLVLGVEVEGSAKDIETADELAKD